jgi:hypothetical protein
MSEFLVTAFAPEPSVPTNSSIVPTVSVILREAKNPGSFLTGEVLRAFDSRLHLQKLLLDHRQLMQTFPAGR